MTAQARARGRPLWIAACAWLALSANDARSAEAPDPARQPDTGRDRGVSEEPTTIDPSEKLFWAGAGLGYGHVSVRSFVVRDARNLDVGVLSTSSGGPSAALLFGVRLGQLTLGLNGSFIAMSESAVEQAIGEGQLWSLDLEGTFRVPFERFEPYILLGGGYSSFGSFGDALNGVFAEEGVDGANLRGGLGFDWFVSPLVSMGARGSIEMLFLTGEISLNEIADARQLESVEQARSRAERANGSSTATAYALTIGPGFHF